MKRSDLREMIREIIVEVISDRDVILIAKKLGVIGTVDLKQLKQGIEVETEHSNTLHTNNSLKFAQIAVDHLKEKPDYYTRLAKAEKENTIVEDTTLRSLVAKAGSEQIATRAMQHLKSSNVQARVADGATFGLSADESSGWGIYVEPNDMKAAAKVLQSTSKGLAFDPYIQGSK